MVEELKLEITEKTSEIEKMHTEEGS